MERCFYIECGTFPTETFPLVDGDVAQLGEHLPCKQGVVSSSLIISTADRIRTSHCLSVRESYLENRITKIKYPDNAGGLCY